MPFSLKSTDGLLERFNPLRDLQGTLTRLAGSRGEDEELPLQPLYFSDLSAVNIYEVPSKLIFWISPPNI